MDRYITGNRLSERAQPILGDLISNLIQCVERIVDLNAHYKK